MLVFGVTITFSDMPFVNSEVSALEIGIVLMTGIFGVGALIFKAKAFQHEQASKLSILHYLYVVLIMLFDIVILQTELTKNEVVGILIIFVSSITSTMMNYK